MGICRNRRSRGVRLAMPDIFLTEEFWLAVLSAVIVGTTVGMAASLLITAATSLFSAQHTGATGENRSKRREGAYAVSEQLPGMGLTSVYIQALNLEFSRLRLENRELRTKVERLERAEIDLKRL